MARSDIDDGRPLVETLIIPADCRTGMRLCLAPKSVHMVVTSPPYFGLRDYDTPGQLGQEQTPEEYVAALVDVFREIWRVLRDDGVVWLNLGDSYASSGGAKAGGYDGGILAGRPKSRGQYGRCRVRADSGLKPKDLIGIPWRVAFTLQADGWYLRQDIIWVKPNPMPESVTDRCTKAHEYIFLLTKSARYYFDAEAIAEDVAADSLARNGRHKTVGQVPDRADAGGFCGTPATGKRNKRSVWTVTTKPFKGAHFATFPPDLIEPCILAGSPVGGVVLDPFGGAGTTALVSRCLGRSSVSFDINAGYCEMAEARLAADKA